MSLLRHRFAQSLIALLSLAAWAGAYHHDAWLELLEIAHHHHEHHDHHDHPAGDHGHGDSDPIPFDQDDGPVHLLDTHSTAVALNLPGMLGAKPTAACQEWLLKALSAFITVPDPGAVDSSDPPPPFAPWRVPEARSVFLAFSVQANAPPFLS